MRGADDAWFKLGRLEVGTTMALVLSVVASWLAWVIVPSLPSRLWFATDAVAAGQVWRLVTWPWAEGLSLFGVINLALFWYFATDLERSIGKRKMATLLGGMWAVLTGSYAGAALLTSDGVGLAGIGLVEFLVLLVWIADSPNRPFFLRIPAWVVGAVLVGLQVFVLMAARAWAALLALVVSMLLVPVLARRVGLLSELAWLPGGPRARQPRPAAVRQPDAPSKRDVRRRLSDEERLDELLDKIGRDGIHSLTAGERKELDKLRERRRGGR